MNTLILRVMTRMMLPLIVLFSVFLLLRGHNSPGGGFAGALVAASVFVLHAIVFGVPETRGTLILSPWTLFVTGLAVAFVSGLMGLVTRGIFLSPFWWQRKIEIVHHVGTPVLFDVGVYLTVFGAVLTIVFSLLEGEHR